MRCLLATSNPHKLDEIRAVLPSDAAIEWWTLDRLGRDIPPPHEDRDTFEANALLKARYYAQATGLVTLADDSGLAVDALGGEPGVRSARYSGMTGPRHAVDAANNTLLLKMLEDIPVARRTARFVCAMALVDGQFERVVRGTFEGRIIGPGELPRGEHGFGYDPIFFVPGEGKTAAQLTPQRKNELSHRGAAARLIWPTIEQRLHPVR